MMMTILHCIASYLQGLELCAAALELLLPALLQGCQSSLRHLFSLSSIYFHSSGFSVSVFEETNQLQRKREIEFPII